MNDGACDFWTDERRKNLRIVYSSNDFQQALSAADFLWHYDPDERISRIEGRRYKMYETAMVVCYARPFSSSHGKTPSFSFDFIRMTPDANQLAMHKKLITLRNKVFGHSDKDMMRVKTKLYPVPLGEGEDVEQFPFLEQVFDEGQIFYGSELVNIIEWLRLIKTQLVKHKIDVLRKDPDAFTFDLDYLYRDGTGQR